MTTSAKHRSLYNLRGLPTLQNTTFATEEAAKSCARGDVNLVQDLETGLVYNELFNPSLVIYDENYQNEQALSPTFQQHLKEVRGIILSRIHSGPFVEIGCGKGHFLDCMEGAGVEVFGFDPAYEGNHQRIKKELFDNKQTISGNCIILRHVLEHIQDPVAFLSSVAAANGHKGLVYIEVPCFDWISESGNWFDVFYEHVNYFRIDDFQRIFGSVIYAGRTFGGQYLSIIADLTTIRSKVTGSFRQATLPDSFGMNLAFPSDPSGQFVVWGGASKGVIYCLMAERSGFAVPVVVDINPAKQGRYLPVTGAPVLSPEAALKDFKSGSTIVVMNPNYVGEIGKMVGQKHRLFGVNGEKYN